MTRRAECSTSVRRRASAMSRDQTIKEGLLYKRGKINTDWKQRLFILNGKQLAYFKGSVSVLPLSLDQALHRTLLGVVTAD